MPTASPSIAPSAVVTEGMSIPAESATRASIETPTPTIAVMMGMTAGTRERNTIARMSRATITPMISPAPKGISELCSTWPPRFASSAAVSASSTSCVISSTDSAGYSHRREVHLELGDDGGAVLGAGAGGEVIEGGGGDGDVLDLADLGHQRVDLVLVLLDGGAVLGHEDHLPGGAAHLREARGQVVDAALALGAGDLDIGGEGAAETDGEAADDHQQHDPPADDLPAQGGHQTAEAVQGRGHGTSRTGTSRGRRTACFETPTHSIHACIVAILSTHHPGDNRRRGSESRCTRCDVTSRRGAMTELFEPLPKSAGTRRRENTRTKLVRASLEVFVEKGIDGVTVDDLVTAAGFTRGAFYSNFSTKEEVFTALFDEVTDEIIAIANASVEEAISSRYPAGAKAGLRARRRRRDARGVRGDQALRAPVVPALLRCDRALAARREDACRARGAARAAPGPDRSPPHTCAWRPPAARPLLAAGGSRAAARSASSSTSWCVSRWRSRHHRAGRDDDPGHAARLRRRHCRSPPS